MNKIKKVINQTRVKKNKVPLFKTKKINILDEISEETAKKTLSKIIKESLSHKEQSK